ncbi:MAG: hypothetical protein JJ992_21760 [Planctomycetes bacterium]|nr:hypothetical protein [Planctomycetota bacterium]
MSIRQFSPGEPVIYRKFKYGASPGPRASQIAPDPRGELYAYHVDKFWIVEEQPDETMLIVLTRRGKRHRVRVDDPNLRRPNWWERWCYAARFPRQILLKVDAVP